MRLGYEDWEFNIRLGAKNIFGKRLPLPLFPLFCMQFWHAYSKSSKYHAQIGIILKIKILNFINQKYFNELNIMENKESSYPSNNFFIWYVFTNYTKG